jgi:hypothetical protein
MNSKLTRDYLVHRRDIHRSLLDVLFVSHTALEFFDVIFDIDFLFTSERV